MPVAWQQLHCLHGADTECLYPGASAERVMSVDRVTGVNSASGPGYTVCALHALQYCVLCWVTRDYSMPGLKAHNRRLRLAFVGQETRYWPLIGGGQPRNTASCVHLVWTQDASINLRGFIQTIIVSTIYYYLLFIYYYISILLVNQPF